MSTRKQPSFGGVAALFGENEPATKPLVKKKNNPSFGGVAGLFGDSSNDLGAGKVQTKPAGTKQKAKPSFGGVAAMFGEDDNEAPDRIITKTKGKNASFGGVASLFGESNEDLDDEMPPLAKIKPGPGKSSTTSKKNKRDPSINGISSLFQNMDDDTDDPEDNPILVAEDLQKNFRAELEDIKRKVKTQEEQLLLANQQTAELESRIANIQAELIDSRESKFALIKSTAEEMRRMKGVISEYFTILDRQDGRPATIG